MKDVFLILAMLMLTACGKSAAPQIPKPPEPPPRCDAFLSWTAPTQYVTGEPLLPEDLLYFTVYISQGGPDSILAEIRIPDINLVSWEVMNLAAGVLQFNMTATATNKQESDWSNTKTKTIDARCP